MNNPVIIKNSFNDGFTLRRDGKLFRYGACQHADDLVYEVELLPNDTFELVSRYPREIKEFSRTPLPQNTSATYGYWEDEWIRWFTLESQIPVFRSTK